MAYVVSPRRQKEEEKSSSATGSGQTTIMCNHGVAQVECIWRVAGLMEDHKSIWSKHCKLKIISKIKELGTDMFQV
jgi:hypothetical protein